MTSSCVSSAGLEPTGGAKLHTRCATGSRAFLLDEYVGLPAGHAQSYHRFIRENFTAQIDIDDAAVLSPDGRFHQVLGFLDKVPSA